MKFTPVVLTAQEEALRAEVRSFLAQEMPQGSYRPGLGMSSGRDPEFSRKLAKAGFVGLSIPQEYGGQGKSAVERFIVVEELLSAGVPVGAHWAADRQTGPTILLFGTEDQRRRFLPPIAAGECYFSLGMSEPDSGSDLASVRTTGERVEGGWLVNGTKVWTSGAHMNHYMVALVRTSPKEGDNRHAGLSQLIIDFSSEGIQINPITFLDGSHSFNEVVMEDVFVPDEMVLGEVGQGWNQVTSELAYERAGPDRYLSAYQLLESFIREHPEQGEREEVRSQFGAITARFWTIRQLALSIARAIDNAQAPAIEAAMLKDLGTVFEQEIVDTLRALTEDELSPDADSLYQELLARSTVISPSYTMRGGTTEVLRSIASKGLAAAR